MSNELKFNAPNFDHASRLAIFAIGLRLILIVRQQFPAGLFEREGFALAYLFGFGWMFGKVPEKALVAAIQSFQHILNRLRTNGFPEGKACGCHPQVGDVRFQHTQRQVLPGQPIVAFVQSQRVIPDCACDVDLLMQILIVFIAVIESVLVGFANFDRMRHALIPA
jgi:hypothetical protein